MGADIRARINHILSDRDRLLQWLSGFVIACAIILTMPSFAIPLGLPAEGDAVDYRIPLVQWILRHAAYPNWPWTIVDDFPSLGELLMVPLYSVSPSLTRLVPILGYAGLAAAGGGLGAIAGKNCGLRARTLFLVGMAWILCLRPVTIQSNLLMVDNFAYCFLLGSLWLLLKEKSAAAGLLAGLSMAVRYTTWATAALLPVLLFLQLSKERRARAFWLFCLMAALGPLPFMVRNFLVNDGYIFFPIGKSGDWYSPINAYGRGKDVLSFLLLPFDLLYTNSFVRSMFDYTLGKLFFIQLFFVAWVSRKGFRFSLPRGPAAVLAFFAAYHLLVWFFSGQQMRFLIPSLVIANIGMMIFLARAPVLLALVTLAGLFSVLSVQKDSILIALGRKGTIFEGATRNAQDCLQRSGVGAGLVGFEIRDGVLGYLDIDFQYVSGHPYYLPVDGLEGPTWIYSKANRPGYDPWPSKAPCLQKRVVK